MGTYVEFSVAGRVIVSTKHEVDWELLTLFSDSDKIARVRGEIVPAHAFVNTVFEEDEDLFLGYESQVCIARDRLDVMGYTMKKIRAIFDEEMSTWRREHDAEYTGAGAEGLLNEQLLLSSIGFDDWFEALGAVLAGESSQDRAAQLTCHRLAPLVLGEIVLADQWNFGFPSGGTRPFVRAVLELFKDEDTAIMDLTDAFHAGWSIVQADDACSEARGELMSVYPLSQKTIVLTEGKSDTWIMQRAMNVLYPHLVEYFSFMDFASARAQGGAGGLVTTVKAFAAAGVANRVVAIVDNDTAAREALIGLQDVNLPDRMKVVTCPAIELARNYPSLGPTGLHAMDVNGLAGSIEMYLGDDVLRDAKGALVPVQWRGYSQRLETYQGEIIKKSEVHQRYLAKLNAAPPAHVAQQMPEWQDIKAVLQAIIAAFD